VKRTPIVAILTVFATALLALGAWPPAAAGAPSSTPDEQVWVTNGPVYATAIAPDGTTYIGGDFTYVAPNTGSGAALDATSGTPDTSSPQVLGGDVYAAASDGAGGYYIGGAFTKVGGQFRNHIAHILADGSVDLTFNPNANHEVFALAVSGSTIYAGGSFTCIGGQTRNRIAALDAISGGATAWDPSAGSTVYALAVSGSTVYAGGWFTSIGGQARNNIAALDAISGGATAWDPNANGPVDTLAVSGSTVYVGGYFTSVGGQTRSHIAALDATSGAATAWNPNANSTLFALAVSGSTVYAGGEFTSIGGQTRNRIAALDATTGLATAWNAHANGGVRALAVSGSTVYVGGNFTSIGGQPRHYIAALDATANTNNATAWNPNAGGVLTPAVYALAVSGATVYAGGNFTTIGGQTRNRIAALDAISGAATTWDPNANSGVRALAVSGSTVYVGGDFTSIGGQPRHFIAALDATANTNNATAWDPNANGEVSALVVSGSTVYAGGWFTAIGGQFRSHIAALPATTGLATAWDPDASYHVSALAVSGSTVYAGGEFTSIGGQPRHFIAALDATANTNNATAWDPNANSGVRALAVSGSTVYAGGEFTSIGGQGRSRIAALDATSGDATDWNPDAHGLTVSPDPCDPYPWELCSISALTVSGSTVYVGGYFTSIGGQTRNHIAALDATANTNNATAWAPYASNAVNTLAVSGLTVYVGGCFESIGGQACTNFAVFSPLPSSSMSLNGGAAYATSTTVTIDSAVTDASEMRFRNAGGSWSDWETYGATKSWTLPSGDGAKKVQAEYRISPGDPLTLSDTIILDTIAPTTGDDAPAGWQTSAVTVTLTATDTTSGVGSISYSTDGGASWVGGASVLVPAPSDGSNDGVHQVSYRATDRAGNEALAKTFSVSIDAGAPTTTDDAPAGWNATDVTVNLSANDTTSGVALTQYSTDAGVTWLTGTSAIVAAPPDGSNDGLHSIAYRSTDNAGNVERASSCEVRIDTQAPHTRVRMRGGRWHNRPVSLRLIAVDALSGVASTRYRLDGGAWTEGSRLTVAAPADHANDGLHLVEFRSLDEAGNLEGLRTVKVGIDTTRPRTRAPLPALVMRGFWPTFTFGVTDGAARWCDVTIVIRDASGALVERLHLGRRFTGHTAATPPLWYRCWLPRGEYTFAIRALDRAGNHQKRAACNRLIVL